MGAATAGIEWLSETIDGELIVIMGGSAKQSDFSPLSSWVQYPIKQVIVIGEEAFRIADALPKTFAVCHASSLPNAVTLASSQAKPKDAVIYHPHARF